MDRAVSYHDLWERWAAAGISKCLHDGVPGGYPSGPNAAARGTIAACWQNATDLTLSSAFPAVTPHKLYDGVTRAAYHLYPFRYNPRRSTAFCAKFMAALQAEGIPCVWGYGRLSKASFIDTYAEFPQFRGCTRRSSLTIAARRSSVPTTIASAARLSASASGCCSEARKTWTTSPMRSGRSREPGPAVEGKGDSTLFPRSHSSVVLRRVFRGRDSSSGNTEPRCELRHLTVIHLNGRIEPGLKATRCLSSEENSNEIMGAACAGLLLAIVGVEARVWAETEPPADCLCV